MRKPKRIRRVRPSCALCAATTSTAPEGKLFRHGAKFFCKDHKPEGKMQ